MIFKRRIIVSLVLLLSGAVLSLKDDFKFDNDDLQVVFTDPVETITKSPSRFLYAKEISQCPATESKLMLTLLLKSRSWKDLSEQKREKAIKKMSRFFAVPKVSNLLNIMLNEVEITICLCIKEYLTVDDVSAPEIYEMIKHSINKSSNLLNTKQKIGRVEFSIGCGDKMFATGKIIAHRITELCWLNNRLCRIIGFPIIRILKGTINRFIRLIFHIHFVKIRLKSIVFLHCFK